MRTGQYSLLIWTVYILRFPATDVRATDIRKVNSGILSWGKWSSLDQCIGGRKSKYRYGVKSGKLNLFHKETIVCHCKTVDSITTKQKSTYLKKRHVSDNSNRTGLETNRLDSILLNLTKSAANNMENNFTESNGAGIKPTSLEGSIDEKKRVSSNHTSLTKEKTPNRKMFTVGENDHEIAMDNGRADTRMQNNGNTTITASSSSDIEVSQIEDDPECKRKVKEISCPGEFSRSFSCGRMFKNGTWSSSCYSIVNLVSFWESAVRSCQRMFNSKLVSIESRLENIYVGKILKELGEPGYRYWTSGSDEKEEGSWEWTATGEPVTFTDWLSHEPDNSDNEDYLAVGTERSSSVPYWTDKSQRRILHYICEISVRDSEV